MRAAELTGEHWQGQAADVFHLCKGKMPIVANTLELLREDGSAGPVFWCFGREGRQNFWDAIGNPRRDVALARRAEEARLCLAQEAAEREAQRPVCGECGQKFADDRWQAGIAFDWGRGGGHPHLCDDCKARVLEAERPAEQAERERQEQERQEAAAQASKAGGWLGRGRSAEGAAEQAADAVGRRTAELLLRQRLGELQAARQQVAIALPAVGGVAVEAA
ncbi:hypothetical protein ACF1G5_37275 [Streptomyces coeruleorubidus]|uniref:hypothetical protein n=1 Tax=Streptomyces coeruleorubidus TaxID=116188 RepID=UPI0036F6991D